MEQIACVSRILSKDVAEVTCVPDRTCSHDCHQCGGCGNAKQTFVVRAKNTIGARIGDWVKVEAKPDAVLKAAAMLYLLPLLLLIAGYLLGEHLWQRGVLVSLCGLMLGFVLAKLLDRKMSQKDDVYIITGMAKGPNAE